MDSDKGQNSDIRSRFLSKVIKRAASGTLPASMTLGYDPDGEAFWELAKLLRGHLTRHPGDGRLRVDLSGDLANPEFWLELGGCSSSARESHPADALDQAIKRLLLEHPEASSFSSAIRASAPIQTFTANGKGGLSALSRLYSAVTANDTSTTLSQLGADLFNDSKVLRHGSGYNALVSLASIVKNFPDDFSRRKILSACGIEENPFTSFVTAFVPFSFALSPGTPFYTFPEEFHAKGLAVQLPLETVKRIVRVSLPEGLHEIATSENAAPFAAFVARGISCVYTEGYPNSAVRKLLTLFAQAGLSIRHYGDTDLDGRLIAQQVFKCIPGVMEEPPADTPAIPLTESAAKRLSAWLDANPDHPHADRLSATLKNGWIEQEAWSTLPTAAVRP